MYVCVLGSLTYTYFCFVCSFKIGLLLSNYPRLGTYHCDYHVWTYTSHSYIFFTLCTLNLVLLYLEKYNPIYSDSYTVTILLQQLQQYL